MFEVLAETALLLRCEGATWHPALELRERGEQLSLHCPDATGEGAVLSVPRPLLIPLSGLSWHNTPVMLSCGRPRTPSRRSSGICSA
ncbi:hypothetical protein [Cyanobium sp. PCC 7001]|uniref:hypothetical protein n=1 Tax=Cyanobium sp. PCC 7001 TaxID=180281 RepID=UPI0002D56D9C|nr:hypothetical protein [Cyanobium sp. PCC 7001]